MKFILKLFRTPSTSKALAGFNKAIAELEAVVEHHNAEVEALDAEIAARVTAMADAKDKASEAARIAGRVRKLVA